MRLYIVYYLENVRMDARAFKNTVVGVSLKLELTSSFSGHKLKNIFYQNI